MVKLLDGGVVPGTEFVILERLLAEFSKYPEPLLDASWHAVQFTTRHLIPKDGPRIWFKRHHPDGDPSWTSLHPGEHRREPPEQPCIVYDVPEGKPVPSCRDMVAAALKRCSAVQPMSGREERIERVATERLTLAADAPLTFPHELRDRMRAALDGGREPFEQIVQYLYDEWLLDYRCTCDYFTAAIALMQLQAVLNLRIREDWCEDPLSKFYAFIREVVQNPEARAVAKERIVEICNAEFAHARQNVIAAINAKSVALTTGKLYLAFHLYKFCLLIEHAFRETGHPLEGLGYDPILVEEAMVCTGDGIGVFRLVAVEDIGRWPHWCADELHDSLEQNLHAMRRWSSEILPVFTKEFIRILAAQALTVVDDGKSLGEGIAELERLRAKVPADAFFEQGWLMMCLLRAHKKTADTDTAQRLAVQIAARVMLSRRQI